VPEYGTANGRLHFHAVHFMRTLPTGSVDPNFGRRVRNRRQLNSLQNTWPYGYNAWERAGADASSAGMVDAGFENQKELTKMQLDNQKEIAEMQNETQKEIAGIQSATSRQNTKDQVYAQNEMLAYQQKESTARVASIMENTNL